MRLHVVPGDIVDSRHAVLPDERATLIERDYVPFRRRDRSGEPYRRSRPDRDAIAALKLQTARRAGPHGPALNVGEHAPDDVCRSGDLEHAFVVHGRMIPSDAGACNRLAGTCQATWRRVTGSCEAAARY